MTGAATAESGHDDRIALIGKPPPPVRRDAVVQTWVAAATLSWLGDAIFAVALTWTAVHLLSPALAGVVVAVETIPQAVLMLPGGAMADRLDTRAVMIGGEFLRIAGLTLTVALWSLGHRDAPTLLTASLVLGVAAGLSNPARATLARQLVRTADLATVSGWTQVGSRLARLAGAPIGGALVAVGGFVPALLIDVASFGCVAVALVAVVRPRYRLPRAPAERWTASVRDCVRYLRQDRQARTLTLGLSSLNVFLTPVMGVGVALRVSQAGWRATWMGVAEGCFAAGAIVGSLVAISWAGRRETVRAFWVLTVQGVAIGAVGAPSRATLVAAMIVIGLSAGLGSVWLSASFQRVIAPSHLGRVSSVNQLGDLLLTPVTLPVFGLVVAHSGLVIGTLVCGAAMAALCLAFATSRTVRAIR